jgi:hypothetical protein
MGIKHIFSHICGDQNLNLPYLAQIPMGEHSIVSIGHEVDLETAIRYFGDTCIIAGNVEPAIIQHGSPQEVYDLAFNGSQLFAATRSGIFFADINNPNLIDYSNWQRINTIPSPNSKFNCIVNFNNKLYVNNSNDTSNYDKIYYYNDTAWMPFEDSVFKDIYYMQNCHDKLVITGRNKIKIFDKNSTILYDNGIKDQSHCIIDKDNEIWIARITGGLYRNYPQNPYPLPKPNRPPYTNAVRMSIENDLVLVAGGTITYNFWQGYCVYMFKNEKWEHLNNKLYSEDNLYLEYNVNDVIINPDNPNQAWVATNGFGLRELINLKPTVIYDETNSEIENIDEWGPGYSLISDLEYDIKGNLWFTLDYVPTGLYVRTTKGIIRKIKNTGFNFSKQETGRIATSGNTIFVLLIKDYAGILAYNHGGSFDNETDDKQAVFTVMNQDNKKFKQLKTLASDLDGNIWVGTTEGCVVYYDPDNVYDQQEVKGYQIKIPRNDGTGLADYALGTESITSIAVDGANRKWFGTEKSGVYLFSADGTEQIHNFKTENSPLPSNSIIDIAINHLTGEVYFSTDKGIVSYKSDATKGLKEFDSVYVYPNPVHQDYSGTITITGLVENTNVKITDISGKLVYENTALGGQVTWDGKSFHGTRVGSGIYLVYCTDKNGNQTAVVKLLFLK